MQTFEDSVNNLITNLVNAIPFVLPGGVYLIVGAMYVEELIRWKKWDTKLGTLQNILIIIFWPPILIIRTTYKFITFLCSLPAEIYHWWSQKPDQ